MFVKSLCNAQSATGRLHGARERAPLPLWRLLPPAPTAALPDSNPKEQSAVIEETTCEARPFGLLPPLDREQGLETPSLGRLTCSLSSWEISSILHSYRSETLRTVWSGRTARKRANHMLRESVTELYKAKNDRLCKSNWQKNILKGRKNWLQMLNALKNVSFIGNMANLRVDIVCLLSDLPSPEESFRGAGQPPTESPSWGCRCCRWSPCAGTCPPRAPRAGRRPRYPRRPEADATPG